MLQSTGPDNKNWQVYLIQFDVSSQRCAVKSERASMRIYNGHICV